MTVEEQEIQDKAMIEEVRYALETYRGALNRAWGAGVDVRIQTQNDPSDTSGAMWPTIIYAGRHKVYVDEMRKR